MVAGADEAGRGCLAGPLVAAAVLIDYEGLSHADRRALAGLHDSKQMKPERREELYPAVLRAASRVSVVIRSARGIDDRGLHVTNIEALASALERLAPGEEATCLVDGFSLRGCAVAHRAVIEGDGTSAAIAAASVIAKVTRDRYMHGAAGVHPGWGSRTTSATRPPSTARRSSGSASHPCIAVPSSRSPTRSWSWLAKNLEGAGNVLDVEHIPDLVEGDADRVEADLGVGGNVSALAHPSAGEAADAGLLAEVDREDGALGAEGRAGAAGLYLDEDQREAVEGDDVELAVAAAGIALDDLPLRIF
jgi:ribonuclease HII